MKRDEIVKTPDRNPKPEGFVECPHCAKRYAKGWADEWMRECVGSPVSIVCDHCGGVFKMKAIPKKVLWVVSCGDKAAEDGITLKRVTTNQTEGAAE